MIKGRALAASAIIVAAANFFGRIFGFIREMVIANKFGASAQTDAFLVAFTIPNILYSLIVAGALSASFIPIFTGFLANDKEKEAWHLAYSVFNLLLIVFGFVAAALVIFAPQVIFLAAPGFAKSYNQLSLGSNLLRLMAPALILLGISGLMTGVLNSYNHFSTPSLVSLTQNALLVISILVFAKSMGIYGAALGLLFGAAGQVLIQLPAFVKRRLPYRPVLDLRHESFTGVAKLFFPVLIALSASQSNTFIDKWMASFLNEGSISYLNYAYKVASLPVGTFIAAIAIVLFPTLSQQAAKGDVDLLRSTVSIGIRIISLITVPATVGFFMLSMPIVGLLFEHGAFDRTATVATSSALAAYSFGLLAMGLSTFLVRSFYALKDGMTPLKASIAFVIVLIGFDVLLIRSFSHVGLALGYVFAVTLMVAMLFLALRKRLQGLDEVQLAGSLLKIAFSAVVMGAAIWYVKGLLIGVYSSGTKFDELVVVGLAILAGIIVYALSLVALRASEVLLVWRMVREKLVRSQSQTT
ncbi:MAG: murein biosynthesis integral membrane protein MurJ [Actinomycetota bacterium]